MSEKAKDILEWIYCIIIALVLALLFRYFIATPTIVKQRSMFPTLKENQRLLLNRTYRITKNYPERGDIITFEAPSVMEIPQSEVDQSKPMARYEKEPTNIFSKFVYYPKLFYTFLVKRSITNSLWILLFLPIDFLTPFSVYGFCRYSERSAFW